MLRCFCGTGDVMFRVMYSSSRFSVFSFTFCVNKALTWLVPNVSRFFLQIAKQSFRF